MKKFQKFSGINDIMKNKLNIISKNKNNNKNNPPKRKKEQKKINQSEKYLNKLIYPMMQQKWYY